MSEAKWDLTRLDNGELSILRRSAGQALPESDIAAMRAFYRACGYCDPKKEKYWFPAVCMDALWRSTDSFEEKKMEECLQRLFVTEADTSDSIKHRADMLLETAWDDQGFLLGKLLNLVKIIKSRTQLKPDFQALADDLQKWNAPRQSVQRKWLRTMYNVNTNNKQEEVK